MYIGAAVAVATEQAYRPHLDSKSGNRQAPCRQCKAQSSIQKFWLGSWHRLRVSKAGRQSKRQELPAKESRALPQILTHSPCKFLNRQQ